MIARLRAAARRPILGLVLVMVAALAPAGCTERDGLVLLDLRASGPLGAEVVRVRLSAKGWPTKVVTGTIGSDGLRVGYYGPADGGAVSVTAKALDAVDCVLGTGSATVPALAAGATSDPTTLFIRPTPDTGCVPDAGTGPGDDAGQDADEEDVGGDTGEADAGSDSDADGDGDGDAGTE